MMRSWFWKNWGLYCPRVELKKFKNIEFFPPSPPDFKNVSSICIGSKTRTIGDPLLLSTLPRKLKALYPKLKIYTYPRGFNSVVFYGNPYVDGVQWLPDTVYGDDCNLGTGHLIQRKERFFHVPVSENVRPEIYLLPQEERWIDRLFHQTPTHRADHLPLCILHPWGKTRSSVLSQEVWERIVRENQGRVRFWQVGIEGQTRIAGCERHLLLPKDYSHARKLFAAMSRAQFFIGVDSGPMHVARAFALPSLILTNFGVEAWSIFSERHRLEKGSGEDWSRFFIYEENQHFDVIGRSSDDVIQKISQFIHDEADE
jgi:ADP-heptose:LPS heptosyltransferase